MSGWVVWVSLVRPSFVCELKADASVSVINMEYEFIALHRDVGETELRQARELRRGGNLVYIDSPVVRAAKHGRILIIEGIEKAERGIMPVRTHGLISTAELTA